MGTNYTTIDLLMVDVYVNLIRVKKRTLESVPEKIRGLVKDKLIERGIYKEKEEKEATDTTEGGEKAE